MQSNKKKKLCVPLVSLLIAIFVIPLLMQSSASANALSTSNSETDNEADSEEWRTIQTSFITVKFPADGRKPMFLWWYNKEPENIYIVKFDGLREHFTFNASYYMHQAEAEGAMFGKLLNEELEHPRGIFKMAEIRDLLKLREVVGDITQKWGHPAYLPFSGCKWTLQNVGNIKADDGKVIGFAFTFNLTRALPRFKFAEDNIAIRVRFYNTTVTEDVKDAAGTVVYSYKVGAGEMKMDFVVKNWRWNLDLVQPLLTSLRGYGVNVPQTKTSLALEIHLASLSRTALESNDEDEEVNASATTSRISFENSSIELSKNKVDAEETPVIKVKTLTDNFKLKFTKAENNQTLAGFFKYIASAMVINSSGSYRVPVNAAYRRNGASLKVFISYPYFNGTLVHDPSIGVETPETTTASAKTASYQVTVGGSSTAALSAHLAAPPILSTQMIIILVIATTAIALGMLAIRRRGRAIVLRSF